MKRPRWARVSAAYEAGSHDQNTPATFAYLARLARAFFSRVLAQLAECVLWEHEVAGSSPARPTNFAIASGVLPEGGHSLFDSGINPVM